MWIFATSEGMWTAHLSEQGHSAVCPHMYNCIPYVVHVLNHQKTGVAAVVLTWLFRLSQNLVCTKSTLTKFWSDHQHKNCRVVVMFLIWPVVVVVVVFFGFFGEPVLHSHSIQHSKLALHSLYQVNQVQSHSFCQYLFCKRKENVNQDVALLSLYGKVSFILHILTINLHT